MGPQPPQPSHQSWIEFGVRSLRATRQDSSDRPRTEAPESTPSRDPLPANESAWPAIGLPYGSKEDLKLQLTAMAELLPEATFRSRKVAKGMVSLAVECLRQGIQSGEERWQLLVKWLYRDLVARAETTESKPAPSGSLKWMQQVRKAVRIGLEIQSLFNQRFVEWFRDDPVSDQIGRGVAAIHKFLWSRLGIRRGEGRDRIFEAIWDRIQSKRSHFLDSFRRKYQPSLFSPLEIDPEKMAGYFSEIARTESLKIPDGELPWNGLPITDEPSAWDRTPDADAISPESQLQARAEILQRWWSRDRGFSSDQQLEGLVSAGLGAYCGDAEISAAVRRWLREHATRRDASPQDLTRKTQRLLLKLRALEYQSQQGGPNAMSRDEILRKIERMRGRLDRLYIQLSQPHRKLMPSPADVQSLLAERMENTYQVRFRRLERERGWFLRRAVEGWRRLPAATRAQLPADLRRDGEAFVAWLEARPGSRGSGRKAALEKWRESEAGHLAALRRWWQRRLELSAGDRELRVERWLADTLDFLEFGSAGLIDAMKSRTGWRLENLLREV